MCVRVRGSGALGPGMPPGYVPSLASCCFPRGFACNPSVVVAGGRATRGEEPARAPRRKPDARAVRTIASRRPAAEIVRRGCPIVCVFGTYWPPDS